MIVAMDGGSFTEDGAGFHRVQNVVCSEEYEVLKWG